MAKPRKRQVKRHKGSIIFKGTTYWFYSDHFMRYKGRLTGSLKADMSKLRKAGYKVRLVRPTLSYNLVEIYTNPKVPGIHTKHF